VVAVAVDVVVVVVAVVVGAVVVVVVVVDEDEPATISAETTPPDVTKPTIATKRRIAPMAIMAIPARS